MKVEHHVYVHWSTADVGAALRRIEATLATLSTKEQVMAFKDDVLAKIAAEKDLILALKAAFENGLIPADVQAAILANLDENTASLLAINPPPPTP